MYRFQHSFVKRTSILEAPRHYRVFLASITILLRFNIKNIAHGF